MFEKFIESTFPLREESVLTFWQQHSIFERSLAHRQEGVLFNFYDGPPFATGLPHYGHLLTGTIKDVIPRYKTMKGYRVPRRFGWDCHGLPVENEIEKSQNLSGAACIEAFGIERFNEECRKIVLRYVNEWESVVKRMGRWVDFSQTYKTMDKPFMESVWWVFKQLYEKGLVYEGFKVMPYSAKLGTPLSNFEASENYKDVDDPSLTVCFQLEHQHDTFLLVWTTTPWTLLSNIAIAVGPDIDYVKVIDPDTGKKYILAHDRLDAVFSNVNCSFTVQEKIKGRDLEGLVYRPLFSHFCDLKEQGAFHVVAEDFVATDEGTGLVHSAPGFGEVDFFACQKRNLPLVCPVDANCQFNAQIPEYQGRFVKDCDKEIIRTLKQEGKVFHHSVLRHRYPFCWRSDTPLIYRAVTTWFVAVEKIKDKIIAANAQVYWMPGHIKLGRFGKWLEGARDWAISRNRYWGTPIPIWRTENGEVLVVGSAQELEDLTGKSSDDLHRHHIDHLVIQKDGKIFKRISEVFDCWFESGSMPYAQNHYPFEQKEVFESIFPADFIAEGLDQTRGWFYTLMVLSTALFEKPAFKNVVVNGILLAADGSKMSKRLRNYPDPIEMVNKYGADAVRLYMLNSPAVKADDLCFTESGVELVLRQVLLPLWNAYTFFETYAQLYQWSPSDVSQCDISPQVMIDRWIVSLVHKLIKDVEKAMDAYDLSGAVNPFVEFIDQLTNWYIRRSRRRFWEDQDTPDRRQAFHTLYEVLLTLSQVAAPFVPFLSEALYGNLRVDSDTDSVHLCDFPLYKEEKRDLPLEYAMNLVQQTVSLGHSLRKERKLKVRQPLAKAFVVSSQSDILEVLKGHSHLIADELNVQTVEFRLDEHEFVSLIAKPNFRVLGKKIGKLMRAAQDAITCFSQKDLETLLTYGEITLTLEGQSILLTQDDVAVERVVKGEMVAANEGQITIALDTHLTPQLVSLGFAREIINKVNTMRRDQGLAISDRIHVLLDASESVQQAFHAHRAYICGEVLALTVNFGPCDGTDWDLNGEKTIIAISVAS